MDKLNINSVAVSTALISVASAGAMGAFGGMVQYLYLVVNEQSEYKTSHMLSYMILGFFVGMVAHELMILFIGQSYPGVVLVSGFIFMKILDFFQGSTLGDLANKIIKK